MIKVSSNQQSDMRDITLTGTDATIARARQMIQEKVDQVMQRDAERAAMAGGGGGGSSYGTSANAYPTGGSYGSYGSSAQGSGATGANATATGGAGAGAGSTAAAAADPYAAYGGYENYVKAWQMYQNSQAGGAPK